MKTDNIVTWSQWLIDGLWKGREHLKVEDLHELIDTVDQIEKKLPQTEDKYKVLKKLIENDIETAFRFQHILEIILQPIYLTRDQQSEKTVIESFPQVDSRILTAMLIAALESEDDYKTLHDFFQEIKAAAVNVLQLLANQ